jgi:hypothetical protein
MTIVGSDDATEEGSVSVVPITRAMVVGTGTCRSSGVGCPVNSLKEAPRLLATVVSGTSSEDVSVGVKPIRNGVNCEAVTNIANHWDTYSIGEANCAGGCP